MQELNTIYTKDGQKLKHVHSHQTPQNAAKFRVYKQRGKYSDIKLVKIKGGLYAPMDFEPF